MGILSHCHLMRLIIRNTNIYALGWGSERFLTGAGDEAFLVERIQCR